MNKSSSDNNSGSSSSNARRAAAAAPLSNYQFDFGDLGRGSGIATLGGLKQTLPQQQQPPQRAQQQKQQQQHQRQQWTHKPAASLTGTSSMVGDITGRSWVPLDSIAGKTTTLPAKMGSSSGVVGGVGSSKADLFSDLLNTPMNTVKAGGSAPMAAAASMSKGTPMKNAGTRSAPPTSREEFSSRPAAPVGMSAPPPPPPSPAMESLFANRSSSSSSKTSQDPLDDLWRKIPPPAVTRAPEAGLSSHTNASNGMHGLGDDDDWDIGSTEFQAADTPHATAATTELDGLPPPPSGVTGSLASGKGVEFQKQGQFADAIKWLTWAVVLLEKSPDKLTAVLVTRASCYKEVGEYKKAVADCSKVLEMAGPTTETLLQRAYLYESMEKYKLCVKDLREALQRDPSNRMAMNTLARLAKMPED